MKRLFVAMLVIMMMVSGCATQENETKKLTVAVSIVPQASFVKAVAGDLVDVVTLVPHGASPANYQPSPKEMAAFGDASIYYTIGVPTEAVNIIPNIASHNEGLKIVALDSHVEETYPARFFSEEGHGHGEDEHGDDDHGHDEDEHGDDDHGHDEDEHGDDDHGHDEDEHGDDDHGHDEDEHGDDDHEHDEDEHGDEGHEHDEDEHGDDDHEHDEDEHGDEDHGHDEDEHGDDDHGHDDHDHSGKDPHIWMSPKRVVKMVEEIRDTLIEVDPTNKEVYTNNAASYIGALETLEASLTATLAGHEGAAFIIMHPSLGYFADDYGLKMVAIEQSGKEASAAHLQRVIDYGKEHDIRVVLYQAEFDSNQAKTIASELNGEVLEFQPLAADYLENMQRLAETFKGIMR